MKIIVLEINYYPVPIAGVLTTEMCEYLADLGY